MSTGSPRSLSGPPRVASDPADSQSAQPDSPRLVVVFVLAFWGAVLTPPIIQSLIVASWALRIRLPLAVFGPALMQAEGLVLLLTAGHMLLLGTPTFLVMRRLGWIRPGALTLAGFVVAAIPVGVWTWPLAFKASNSTASVPIDGRMTQIMVNGVPTLAGWLQYAQRVVLIGLLGAAGAFVFWLIWGRVGRTHWAQVPPRR